MESLCVNCCVRISNKDKIMGVKILKKMPNSNVAAKEDDVLVSSALNFIYKSTGKKIPSGSDDAGPHGCCRSCWEIIFELYTLHKKLSTLTKLHSLLNQTFNILGSGACINQNIVKVLRPLPEVKVPVIDKKKSVRPLLANVQDVRKLSSKEVTPVETNNLSIDDVEMPAFVPQSFTENDEDNCMKESLDSDQVDPFNSEDQPTRSKSGDCAGTGSKRPPIPRYSGACSEPNCTYTFEYNTRQVVYGHFREVHGREIKLLTLCHICNQQLKGRISHNCNHFKAHGVDVLAAIIVCRNLNSAVLRSKCGLALTRDEYKDPNELKSLEYTQRKMRLMKTRMCQGLPVLEKFLCSQCDTILASKAALRNHVLVLHDRVSKIICPICERPVKSNYALPIHLTTHMNAGERAAERARLALEGQEFLCQECGKFFSSQANFRSHMRIHRDPSERRRPSKVYTCEEPDCGFTCSASRTLNSHKNILHSDSSYYRYRCTRCNEGFRARTEFINHGGYCCDPLERPHLCGTCGKRFKLKQHLEVHYIELHKYEKEAARALVYPGLPLRPWLEAKRLKWRKKKNRR